MVIVGPCSVHDVDAARVYAKALKKLAAGVWELLVVIASTLKSPARRWVGKV